MELLLTNFYILFQLCWKILQKEVGVAVCVYVWVCASVIIPESFNLTVYTFWFHLPRSVQVSFYHWAFQKLTRAFDGPFLHCNFPFSFCYILMECLQSFFQLWARMYCHSPTGLWLLGLLGNTFFPLLILFIDISSSVWFWIKIIPDLYQVHNKFFLKHLPYI